MRRRVIALVAALALAGVGTLVLVTFVRGAEERAGAGEEEVMVWRVIPTLVGPIEAGTAVSELGPGQIEQAMVDQDSLPALAITDQTLERYADQVVTVDLQPGETLLASRFGAAPENETRAEGLDIPQVAIPEGYLEVPVRFDPEQALGGIIAPGQTVAIIATFDAYPGAGSEITVEDPAGDGADGDVPVPSSADNEDSEGQAATAILINKALISQVQSDAPVVVQAEGSEGVLTPATSFLITFALPPLDAQRLVFAAGQGQLWLAYQDAESDEAEASIITIDEIFTQG